MNDRTELPVLLASITTAIESLTAISKQHAEALQLLADTVSKINARVQALEHSA